MAGTIIPPLPGTSTTGARPGTGVRGAAGMFIPPPQEAVGGTDLTCPHHRKMKAGVRKSQSAIKGTLLTPHPLHAGTRNVRRSTAEAHKALAMKCVRPTQARRTTLITNTLGHVPRPEQGNGS